MSSDEKKTFIRDKLPSLNTLKLGHKAHSAIMKSRVSYNAAVNKLHQARLRDKSKGGNKTTKELMRFENGCAAEVIETLRLAEVRRNNPTWLEDSQEWLNHIRRRPDLTLKKPSVDKETGNKIPGTYVDIKNGMALESARDQLMAFAAEGNFQLVSGSSSSHLFPSIHESKHLMHESVQGRANEKLLRELEEKATANLHTFLLRTTSMTEGALVSVDQARKRAALHETDSAAFDQRRDNSPEGAGVAGTPAGQNSANDVPTD